jgi:hypothetical protein
MTATDKDIFFYSKRCTHSLHAIETINKVGKDRFILIDVESEQDIPEFIDRVPAILTSGKKTLFEDELINYLKSSTHVKDGKEAEPFMVNEMSGLSDKYSYMDDSVTVMDLGFEFLDNPSKIITPNEEDNNKIINYEEALNKRDNDLKNTAPL